VGQPGWAGPSARKGMTENHLSSCPECGGNVKRLIGAGAGAIFKGSGFYQTDYKNSSNNSNQKSEKKTSTVNETPKKKKDTSEKSYKK
jgi:predicted nucleic acid-binding Zn ribbon protein